MRLCDNPSRSFPGRQAHQVATTVVYWYFRKRREAVFGARLAPRISWSEAIDAEKMPRQLLNRQWTAWGDGPEHDKDKGVMCPSLMGPSSFNI